jgi:hypothetical protein
MVHMVIRLPSSAEIRDRSQASVCEIGGRLSGSDVGFLRVRSFSLSGSFHQCFILFLLSPTPYNMSSYRRCDMT